MLPESENPPEHSIAFAGFGQRNSQENFPSTCNGLIAIEN
jgi:hypothetical protein